MRKAYLIGAAWLAAVLATGCGEGRAIFNVDVLSFIQPSGRDTIPYNVPGGIAADSSIPPIKVGLPGGLGSSIVDSVQITAAANLENAAGAGTIGFLVFFAKDSGLVYTTTPFINARGTVSGAQTVSLLPPTVVSLGDTVFNTNALWVGVRAHVSANLGPNLTGRVRLTTLRARIALQDKIF